MFKNWNPGSRLYLSMGLATVVIFAVFSVCLRNYVANTIAKIYKEAMQENLMNVEMMVRLEANTNLEKAILGGNLAANYFKELGEVVEHPNRYVTVNTLRLPLWTINGHPVQNNYDIVDAIKGYGAETATIFQRFENGYMRVSTNVMNSSGERAVGTTIGWDSPVVQAIEKGEQYQGRAWVVNRWYETDYRPIFIDGLVKGILYVGHADINHDALSQYFATKSYFGSGYPYTVDKNGVGLAHPYEAGISVSDHAFFKKMLEEKEGLVVYDWEGREKSQLFKYIPEVESYVTVGWYTADFNKMVYAITLPFIIATIIAIVLLILLLAAVVRKVVPGINGKSSSSMS